jgi:hypothetical protein
MSVRRLLWVLIIAAGFQHEVRAQCPPVELGELFASDGTQGDHLGSAVAIAGDVVVAAALNDDPHGDDSGSVYVFRRHAGAWAQEAKLVPADGDADDYFGWSVATDGTTITVGAYQDADQDGMAGSVYVFRFDGTSWVQEAKLYSNHKYGAKWLGYSVAVQGDTLVAGAPLDDGYNGEAVVFRRAGGTWTQEAELIPDAALHAGSALAIQDDVLVIGAGIDETGYQDIDAGAAYIYRRSGSVWTQETTLNGDKPNGVFGSAVSLDHDVMIVGAMAENAGAGVQSGAVYVYRFDGSSWQREAKLIASDGARDRRFGTSVAVSGRRALIGSRGGAAYQLGFDGSTWSETARFQAADSKVYDQFGRWVQIDQEQGIVGAPQHDALAKGAGNVYLFDVSAPALWANYGQGWPGTLGVPSLTASASPRLGSDITIALDNSRGSPTIGLLLLGRLSAFTPTSAGGMLLVRPLFLYLAPLPGGGLSLPASVPGDASWCGRSFFLQGLELDPGASQGVSFSPGLELDLGG